jgi:hypothetical protein
MSIITFIKKNDHTPSFEVNFATFTKSCPDTDEKTPSVINKIFRIIPAIFQSLATNSIKIFRNAPVSFRIIVFGNIYGEFTLPENLFATAFKITHWVLHLLVGIVDLSLRDLFKKFFPTQTLIGASSEINTSHIRTSQSFINIDSIDPNVKINDLLNFWDEINFNDPDGYGYMPPTCLKANNIVYSEPQLRGYLQTFITHVNHRTPFLGTPNAYDTEKLLAFYKQIEDAIKISIDTIKKKEQEFKNKNGTNLALYNREQLKEYNNLLEDKARIALDLAIAGNYCGSRYMGEAMRIYYYICADTPRPIGSLKDTIEEILAKERLNIANEHILEYSTDTHVFGTYMSMLGKILGLPGTENIIEQLSHQKFDKTAMLKKFFKKYNSDLIIDIIQKKYKSSQDFRDLISDWLKEQSGDWNKVPEAENKTKHDVLKFIQEQRSNSNSSDIDELINYLKKKNAQLPQLEDGGWQSFIEELFIDSHVKSWRDEKYKFLELDKQQAIIERHTKIKQIESYCLLFNPSSHEILSATTNSSHVFDLIKQAFVEGQLVSKIQSKIQLEAGTIARGLKDLKIIEDAIPSFIDRQRKDNFLSQFEQHLFSSEQSYEISKEFMEWVLVSQGILNNQ